VLLLYDLLSAVYFPAIILMWKPSSMVISWLSLRHSSQKKKNTTKLILKILHIWPDAPHSAWISDCERVNKKTVSRTLIPNLPVDSFSFKGQTRNLHHWDLKFSWLHIWRLFPFGIWSRVGCSYQRCVKLFCCPTSSSFIRVVNIDVSWRGRQQIATKRPYTSTRTVSRTRKERP